MPRLLTAGESHGPALVVIVDGFPAGIPLGPGDVDRELRRRQGGYGRGPRAATTVDRAQLLAGLAGGRTTGMPIAIQLPNPEPASGQTSSEPWRPVPRPGHADLTAALKYGVADFRPWAERASARETAARVAGATVARALLAALGIEVGSHVTAIGGVVPAQSETQASADLDDAGWRAVWRAAEADGVRCADAGASIRMRQAIDRAAADGDTLGGCFEVAAIGCPPGLGDLDQWDNRLDARLAGAVMSVPGVRAVFIGAGLETTGRSGRLAHDPIVPGPGPAGVLRPSNLAGGLEGGLTNGQPVVVGAAMKPIPSLAKPPASVDLGSGEIRPAPRVRGDVCAVGAAAVVAEAMVAWELAGAVLRRYGGDHLETILEARRRDAGVLRPPAPGLRAEPEPS